MADPQQLPRRRPPCATGRASHGRRFRCSGGAGAANRRQVGTQLWMMGESCPSSVTNARTKSSRSDIPVLAGRSIPKKVLNPLGKFPLSKFKRALLMAPTESRKRHHSGRKTARADRKNLFSSGDYSISPAHSVLLRDRQRCGTTKRQRSRVCERVLSGGSFDLVGTDEKVSRNFPRLADFVDHVDRMNRVPVSPSRIDLAY